MAELTLQTEHHDSVTVLSLAGDLDLDTAPVLRGGALAELGRSELTTLVLDLTGLTFLDSTGLGCLVELRNRATARGQSLQLRSVPDAPLRTLTLGGLAPVFGLPNSHTPTPLTQSTDEAPTT